METTCDHDPIKTAMEERQARERERYQRPNARAASGDRKMSSYITPYLHVLQYALRYYIIFKLIHDSYSLRLILPWSLHHFLFHVFMFLLPLSIRVQSSDYYYYWCGDRKSVV